MAKSRGDIFEENKPDLTEEDALTAMANDRTVLSFQTLPIIDSPPNVAFLAVRLVFSDGTMQTFALDRHAGELLRGLLDLLNKGDWKATQTAPTGKRLN